jgi:hypothetical protein
VIAIRIFCHHIQPRANGQAEAVCNCKLTAIRRINSLADSQASAHSQASVHGAERTGAVIAGSASSQTFRVDDDATPEAVTCEKSDFAALLKQTCHPNDRCHRSRRLS